jgi:pyrroloquinoline quinone (PQQ) biosynthesis protein C
LNSTESPQFQARFLDSLREGIALGLAGNHPFFRDFASGYYEREALPIIFRELYILFLEIPKSNLCLAANVDDPVAIEAIRSHMIVELGAEEPDKATHITLYRRFLTALGLQRSELDTYSGVASSQQMRDGLRFISEKEAAPIAMGGFLCTETIAGPVQNSLYAGLQKYEGIPQAALYYFKLHSIIEPMHSDMVCEYIVPFLATEADRQMVSAGAARLAAIYANFWTGVQTLVACHLKPH